MSDVASINNLIAPLDLKVTGVKCTPRNYRYEIKLPADIDIYRKVLSQEKTIKAALEAALGTNEYSYIRKDGYIYIERKRESFDPVPFQAFYKGLQGRKKLMLALGIDENGKKVMTDLSKAPHILVGGTTGSGKSELLHSFIHSLIETTVDLGTHIYLFDPKMSEFAVYKGCPRIQVHDNINDMYNVMEHLVDLMEARYREFNRVGVKDITLYSGPMRMFPIVVIIDELADLMMQCKAIEKPIVRIAQKARACGIHLIIGTQSPRKDIVTGLIKSNMPTRIALKTTSSMESRIILDRNGAEKLYGYGDMLFLGNGSFEPIRIQSAYVSNELKVYMSNLLRSRAPKPQKPEQQPAPKPEQQPIQQPKTSLWRKLRNALLPGRG